MIFLCVSNRTAVKLLCLYSLIFLIQFREEWLLVSQGSFTWFAPVCWLVPVGLASKFVAQTASWTIIWGSHAYPDVTGSRLASFLHWLHALLGKRHFHRAQRFITCDWQISGCQVRFTNLLRVSCCPSHFVGPQAMRLLALRDFITRARGGSPNHLTLRKVRRYS